MRLIYTLQAQRKRACSETATRPSPPPASTSMGFHPTVPSRTRTSRRSRTCPTHSSATLDPHLSKPLACPRLLKAQNVVYLWLAKTERYLLLRAEVHKPPWTWSRESSITWRSRQQRRHLQSRRRSRPSLKLLLLYQLSLNMRSGDLSTLYPILLSMEQEPRSKAWILLQFHLRISRKWSITLLVFYHKRTKSARTRILAIEDPRCKEIVSARQFSSSRAQSMTTWCRF